MRLFPGDRHARYLLGVASIGLGQTQRAYEHFVRVAAGGAGDALATLAEAGLREAGPPTRRARRLLPARGGNPTVIGRVCRDMLNRRNLLALGALSLAACGDDRSGRPPATETERGNLVHLDDRLAVAQVALTPPHPAATAAGAEAVTAFTGELFTRVAASTTGNLVISPYSVITALGMTLQGAKGETAQQIRHVLHAPDDAALASGLGSLAQTLASRAGQHRNSAGKPVDVQLAGANSLWGQRGVRWEDTFITALGRWFGSGMNLVDYRAHTEDARVAINDWVTGQTDGKITELVPRDALGSDARLTLVNATYLKAGWQAPFARELTRPRPFTRPDGSTVQVPMMSGDGQSYGSGPGWAAADLPYAGGQLAITIVLPEAGRFADVERGIGAAWLRDVLSSLKRTTVTLGLPRWKTRSTVSMKTLLTALGMPLAFNPAAADFSGMTTQEKLFISAVLHQGYIAVDENGTEAAAATAVVMSVMGVRVPDAELIADRPFLYILRDVPTGTPLFVGRVSDPSA